MARISIELPTTLLTKISIPVRISDINYGNHVGNDSFVSILHEARLQWLKQHNFSEFNFAGVGLIMASIAIEFKSEAFYGDLFTVGIYCGEISRVGFELAYEITATRKDKTILIAKAVTYMICFDYETKKPVSLTDEMKKVFS